MNSNEKKAYNSLSLGEVVIDIIILYLKKGAEEFAREVGINTTEKVISILKILKGRLSKDEFTARKLALFIKEPERYQLDMEKILKDMLADDKYLANELTDLLEDIMGGILKPKASDTAIYKGGKLTKETVVVGGKIEKHAGKTDRDKKIDEPIIPFGNDRKMRSYLRKDMVINSYFRTWQKPAENIKAQPSPRFEVEPPSRYEVEPPSRYEVEPPSRYADFTFYFEEGNKQGQKVPDGYPLQSGIWYQLEVAVRTKPTGIPSTGGKRDSIREPNQTGNVTIMVAAQAEEADFIEIKEPIQTLELPPLGDSDSLKNALFNIRPRHQSNNINNLAKIMIRLYYEFNLIEVAIISAEIVGKFDNPPQSILGLDNPISFLRDELKDDSQYIDFDNVQPRKMNIHITKPKNHFQFNFAFCNDENKKLFFSAPVRLKPSDLEDILVNIRNTWYDIAMCETYSKQLDGKKDEFLKHIHILAEAGSRLWIKLFKRDPKSAIYKIGTWLEEHPLKPGGIIQVSVDKDAEEFVFPWSLIYDGHIPDKYYEQDHEGFWGLRYCIEQKLPNMKSTDDPIRIADRLKIGFMLYEKLHNADKEKTLLKNLQQRSTGGLEITGPITDAVECYDLLRNCYSHILYFYTHGYTRHRQADIGIGSDLELFIKWYEKLDKNSSQHGNYQSE